MCDCVTVSLHVQVHWWRSQAVRFLLRWPSAYLCHIENKARHNAYGAQMAEGITESLREQAQIRDRVEQEAFAGGNKSEPGWTPSPDLGLVRDPRRGVILYGEREEKHPLQEPVMPRPILSVHVRQGDKGIEQKLFSFDAYMFLAAKLRVLIPHLKAVWLSTEMQVGWRSVQAVAGKNKHYVERSQAESWLLHDFPVSPAFAVALSSRHTPYSACTSSLRSVLLAHFGICVTECRRRRGQVPRLAVLLH